MADIATPISYCKASKALTKKKLEEKMPHQDWGSDELLELRKEIRSFYRTQQTGMCSFCKQNVSVVSAQNCHIEHLVPKSIHPEFIFIPTNLCVICADCNTIKRDQETLETIPETLSNPKKVKLYPRSSAAFKIVHPHFDCYEDHILIVNGYYIDKGSKKGNFTIGACNLNRKLGVFGWIPEVLDEDDLSIKMNLFLSENNPTIRKKVLGELKKKLFGI